MFCEMLSDQNNINRDIIANHGNIADWSEMAKNYRTYIAASLLGNELLSL